MEQASTTEQSQNLPPLVKMVLDGKKPGAFIDCLEGAKQYRRLGLEVIFDQNGLVVAKKQRVSDVLAQAHLPVFPQLQQRVENLLSKVKHKTVAKTLVLLNQMPRVDDEYPVERGNMERPEVALLEGVLLGYKDCCIRYYIETRYLGLPYDQVSEKVVIENDENEHVRCPHCIRTNQFE